MRPVTAMAVPVAGLASAPAGRAAPPRPKIAAQLAGRVNCELQAISHHGIAIARAAFRGGEAAVVVSDRRSASRSA